MAATTSLARQLEQLRATAVDSQPQKSTVAQLGPNLLNVQLSGEQLTLLAKDAFAKLCDLCPSIGSFKGDIFKDDKVFLVSKQLTGYYYLASRGPFLEFFLNSSRP